MCLHTTVKHKERWSNTFGFYIKLWDIVFYNPITLFVSLINNYKNNGLLPEGIDKYVTVQ